MRHSYNILICDLCDVTLTLTCTYHKTYTYMVPSSTHEKHLKTFRFETVVSPVSASDSVNGTILAFNLTLT